MRLYAPITRLYGLCGGCLLRAPDVLQVETVHVYRRVVTFFGSPLAITEALCADCWRVLFELRGVDVGLHQLVKKRECFAHTDCDLWEQNHGPAAHPPLPEKKKRAGGSR